MTFCNFNAIRNDSLQALIESGEMEYFRQLLEFGEYAINMYFKDLSRLNTKTKIIKIRSFQV